MRYKTIDTCLRNRYRKWTLEDLIDACSNALYEFEGIDKGISRRTIQMDIQLMRSEKLGYNAPIIVYDNKFYAYEDPDYSITNTPLSEQDLKMMSEAVEVLRQFKGFDYFQGMTDIVNRLEDHITSAKQNTLSVIDFEKNENLKGLEHLDKVYHAIINKQVLSVKYCSFKARSAGTITLYPYLLKEYRNRWFLFGLEKKSSWLRNLALDRIHGLEVVVGESYIENTLFDPSTFFNDLVGVTKSIGAKAEKVQFWVGRDDAPYIRTKPIHKSQQLITMNDDGSMVFEIEVVINQELQREFLGFANGIRVLAPEYLVDFMRKKLQRASENYIITG